jgi:hypothetical protein
VVLVVVVQRVVVAAVEAAAVAPAAAKAAVVAVVAAPSVVGATLRSNPGYLLATCVCFFLSLGGRGMLLHPCVLRAAPLQLELP